MHQGLGKIDPFFGGIKYTSKLRHIDTQETRYNMAWISLRKKGIHF